MFRVVSVIPASMAAGFGLLCKIFVSAGKKLLFNVDKITDFKYNKIVNNEGTERLIIVFVLSEY